MRQVLFNNLYFRDNKKLRILNRHIAIHDSFIPHQVASATGCDLEVAIGLLLILQNMRLVEGKLLVYHLKHKDDPLVPILMVDIFDGFPSLPFICDGCDEQINDNHELTYDFLFHKLDEFVFKVAK